MKQRSGMLLLLTELSIMLLVFALCAAVCLTIFSASRNMAADAQDLTCAVDWAQAAAAAYKSARGDLQKTAAALDGSVENGRLVCGYNSLWAPDSESPVYRVTVTPQGGGQALVEAQGGDGALFSLTVKAVGYGN